jgi:short-subunit dehydrogenase
MTLAFYQTGLPRMNPSHFRDNVVILTGASMGIGEQMAYQLADQGAQLVLAARSESRLLEIAAKCESRGAKAIAVPIDLTNEAQCQQLIARTVEHYGRIDTLLYNAGRAFPSPFAELPDLTTMRAEVNLNFLGLAACALYALPYLRKTKGRIVGVGSLNSFIGMPGTIGYNSSKHALRGFLNTLRTELRGSGISVTGVFPGAIATARLRETMGEKISTIPTMTPERCAELILLVAGTRRRQLIMTPLGRLLVWLYQLGPSLLEGQLTRVGSLYSREENKLPQK